MDTSLLLALVHEQQLPLEDTLQYLPYLHNAYIEVITAKDTTNV